MIVQYYPQRLEPTDIPLGTLTGSGCAWHVLNGRNGLTMKAALRLSEHPDSGG